MRCYYNNIAYEQINITYALINKQQLFIFYGKERMPRYGLLIYIFFEMIRCSVEELGVSTKKVEE
jgi:hypothetical protein